MTFIEQLKEKIWSGDDILKEEAILLYQEPLEELCQAANEIREHFCQNRFDICTIINGKSGKCSEDCKYCAQSAYYHTSAKEYPLLDTKEIVRQAKYNAQQGVLRYSIVTSGRALKASELEQMCEAIRVVREQVDIKVCVSFGLLNEEQFGAVKAAGASRVHNNLETSERFFPHICTTHTVADKIAAIRAAKAAGMQICSGGIIGLSETMEDRIDLALTLRELSVSSVPVNVLNPIPGTPLECQPPLPYPEIRRTIAILRFLLPKAAIRLAGGRGLLPDKGKACFLSGANAAISGDMLTTSGISIENDMELLAECGFVPGVLECETPDAK